MLPQGAGQYISQLMYIRAAAAVLYGQLALST
jgi:hypothetical protein